MNAKRSEITRPEATNRKKRQPLSANDRFGGEALRDNANDRFGGEALRDNAKRPEIAKPETTNRKKQQPLSASASSAKANVSSRGVGKRANKR